MYCKKGINRQKISHGFLYRNGLTIVFFVFFIASWMAQAIFGLNEHNEFLEEHHQLKLNFLEYLHSGHFIQATFENWESEFLQMGLFVVLTIFLRQQGSSESKSLDAHCEDDGELTPHNDAPWPVKRGGIFLAVYQHSLSIALFLLFFIAFVGHFLGSWKDYEQNQTLDGAPVMAMSEFICNPKFWFESFQNWQSEFLSVGMIVWLSIYLRQKGSSQSKRVNAPNYETK